MTREQIFAEAMTLDAREREALAEELLLTVDDGTREEIDTAWADEIERRLAEYERGDVKAVPVDDMFRRLRAKYSR